MKLTGLRGKLSYLKFITDEGVFQGKGELLSDGFYVYSGSIQDESGNIIGSETLKDLKESVQMYTNENCKEFVVYFE